MLLSILAIGFTTLLFCCFLGNGIAKWVFNNRERKEKEKSEILDVIL